MPTFPFTVDAALLSELGERLVGRPPVALGELVKNAYDADAREVRIRVLQDQDLIEVVDNGHGMTVTEFRDQFMRIGTVHKVRQRVSRLYERPLTGSKGVGRLAVQMLGGSLEVLTMGKDPPGLRGTVVWGEAAAPGSDLTEATLDYELVDAVNDLPGGSKTGTILRIRGLGREWSEEDLQELARDVWWIRGPFGKPTPDVEDVDPGLDIGFEAGRTDLTVGFEEQLEAVMEIWHARITGELDDGVASFRLEMEGLSEPLIVVDLDHRYDHLRNASVDIRIYDARHRQPRGIKVGDLREYLRQWGGVHVLDAGFRLPYYGNKENDWLGIERDHASRKSRSQLLPDALQVKDGMSDLPTTRRILGGA